MHKRLESGETNILLGTHALLEDKVKQLNENRLLSIIQKDKIAVDEKPWLLHSGVNESTTRFAIEYGKISSEVWIDFIVKKPDNSKFIKGRTFPFDVAKIFDVGSVCWKNAN